MKKTVGIVAIKEPGNTKAKEILNAGVTLNNNAKPIYRVINKKTLNVI
ncbi:UNVERIFIED_CONTAM: hypothetical protein O8I53_05945 [Campylobacter lari]